MIVPSQKAIEFAESKVIPTEGGHPMGGDGLQIEGLPFVVSFPSWQMTIPEKTLQAYREGVVLSLARLFDEYTNG